MAAKISFGVWIVFVLEKTLKGMVRHLLGWNFDRVGDWAAAIWAWMLVTYLVTWIVFVSMLVFRGGWPVVALGSDPLGMLADGTLRPLVVGRSPALAEYAGKLDVGSKAEIQAAAALESRCDWRLVWALWRTETGKLDCHGVTGIGPGTCTSSAGAKGPLQFMPGTWPEYSEPGWDFLSLKDSSRAACRMNKVLRLAEQTSESAFVRRFTGADGGLAWNRSVPQARQVWALWKSAK